MADGVLGLGSGGASSLNQELIDKLKAAESKARIDPWTTKLENWDKELEKTTEIETKIAEVLSKISNYDLYSSTANAFEQMSASTTGTAAVFNAVDVSGLTEGTNNVTITQLAQRDVYQTSTFADASATLATGQVAGDKISIQIGTGTAVDFSTEGKTYTELAADINNSTGLTASVEQVGDSEYRLVIKSTDSGEANALTITQTGVDLGINGQLTSNAISGLITEDPAQSIVINGETFTLTDKTMSSLASAINSFNGGATFNASALDGVITITRDDGSDVTIDSSDVDLGFKGAVVTAQNLEATVDGVAYDVSSNTITIQGNLTMTAVETGSSTISVQRDESAILTGLDDFITSYNELVTLVATETLSSDAVLDDTSSIKMIMSSVKDMLFGEYGADSDQNIFSYGFELDSSGFLSINTDTFATSLNSNFDDLKTLFIGTAENEGLGTVIKEYLDDLDGYEGIMTQYGENLADKKIDYEDEKEKAQIALDAKYALMSSQFAAYGAIITQMEAAFGGMKMMIAQSTASNWFS